MLWCIWIVGGCGASVTNMIDPSQRPLSRSILVYLRYGPKYTPFVGATLYMSIPLLGGGPVKPATAVVPALMPIILSGYPGVIGANPGDPSGVFPN
jgi:hypothetical protein